ncbi:MAG: FAD-dependent oxidoreductase [Acidimicrobiales bacterium]
MGSLHEHNPSLWVATTEPGELPPLDGDAHADVVVVGAGITGLTTARLLTAAGARVVVVDAGPICAGATGYTTAKVTSLHGLRYRSIADAFDEERARLHGEANEAGLAEIARLVEADGIDCAFERRGHVVYTTDPARRDDVQAEIELAQRLGLPASASMGDDLPFAVAAAVRFDHQGQLHPRAFCLGLAGAVTAAGGRIHAHTRARLIEEGRVVTDHGELSADAVVVATHLPPHELGGYFARCEARRSYAIAITVDGPRPVDMHISADSPTRSLRTAVDHLIVGGEGHKVGELDDTADPYGNLERWAREQFAVRSVDHRWSAQDWVSADGLPYIGRLPGHDRVFVATAFAKWGMAQSAAAAIMVRDLIGGRDNPWLEAYDATRVAPRQSAKGVASVNLSAGKHMIGDRVGVAEDSSIDSLPPGDGVVVRIDGHPTAVHRDDAGELHAVSAVCTHLGCLLSFNRCERSWDCPCHGSRFTVDGAVLEGPAVDDLAEKELA